MNFPAFLNEASEKSMAEETPEKYLAPRFVEMPKALKLDVVHSDAGLALDFTYQPPDKTDPITMRLPMSVDEARELANMLASSSQGH